MLTGLEIRKKKINTLCHAALTCVYADSLSDITAKVIEEAASKLQSGSYSERVDKRRQKLAANSVDSRLHTVLSERARSLTKIAVCRLAGVRSCRRSSRPTECAWRQSRRPFEISSRRRPQIRDRNRQLTASKRNVGRRPTRRPRRQGR
mgnify:CR=1 FL=1